ncbi:MAG: methionine--tRNA ligase [Thermodesulfobacteriota bacterium]|nr:methionine--tRNA ligase [Thermodesulfobacteriota bacterium]
MSVYITTPIFYVNAQPHLGHAYTTIVADTMSRFWRLCGEDVRFQTGTDEHGDKIAQAAQDSDQSPKEFADRISGMFRETWPILSIKPDNFIRTTDKAHIKLVQTILQKIYDNDDFYFSEYSGRYCKGCERFMTEKELVDGKCPDHKIVPEEISEQNYFFRMSKYQDWLINHIKSNPEFITPARYKNEALSFLKEPLEDLCISRPTSRLTWGIPLPFDDRFVTYVWFDALINYLAGIGYPDGPDFSRYWDNAEHVIAKDILKPHAIYWPTMLKAMGLAPYKRLHVHGYWNINNAKMSKSLGNVIRPAGLVEKFGPDTTRYFLLREMSFGLDASFSETAVTARRNSDLANDLGNLLSRSMTMLDKFAGAEIPSPGEATAIDRELADTAAAMPAEFSRHMKKWDFNRALQSVWKLISRANKYIVTTEPWCLAKDPVNAQRLDTVLYHLFETLRLINLVLYPIMPETALKMATALGTDSQPDLNSQAKWGILKPGTTVNAGPPLFPRLDTGEKGGDKKKREKGIKPVDKNKKKSRNQPGPDDEGLITFDEFKRLDLRVGEIVAAEKIKKSDRLLKLTVKAPEERTVVAGIAEFYEPRDVVGRQVIIVANLKPVKLMGTTSHGMILAAKDGDRLVLSAISNPVQPGSEIS